MQFRKDDEKFFLTATFEEWECHMVIKKCQASKFGYEYFTGEINSAGFYQLICPIYLIE